MAIDLAAIRKKLGQLNGQNSKKNAMWRPEEGSETTIRLLAYPNNDGQPFKELMFYYNIGNNPGLLAPYQFDKPDPIQELITKLRDEGTKESYELAKKLYPKMRCYAPVIVRGEEEKGVRLWAFGKTVYQTLLNYMLDEDYGDITDPIEGRDVRVSCTKNPGQQWATTDVRPRGKDSPLSEDSSQSKKWLDNIPDVNDLFELKSYEDLEKIINTWLDDDEEEEKPSFRGGSSQKSSNDDSPDAISGKYKDLDDAFADLEAM
jgi:hypothetical protein|tara:strand:- start:95 stop:877 length:783 start_codon:yes stop_codon:yes gene_type:complete